MSCTPVQKASSRTSCSRRASAVVWAPLLPHAATSGPSVAAPAP